MVAIVQCPVIQEHDAHDWSFKLTIDGNYVPRYFCCNGVQLHLVDEMDYPSGTETNPSLYKKLMKQTPEEQTEAPSEGIIGEDKRAEDFKVSPGSIITLPQPDFRIRPDIEAIGMALETMVRVMKTGQVALEHRHEAAKYILDMERAYHQQSK